MANIQSICVITLYLLFNIRSGNALYEDQVGKFDWKKSFIGKVNNAEFEGKRIIVSTEQNVLAALSLNSGNLLWRQVLEDPSDYQFNLLKIQKNVITVSGNVNSWFVRSWDVATGSIINEWTLASEKPTKYEFSLVDSNLYVLEKNSNILEVKIYDVQTGNVVKELRIPFVVDPELSQCVLAKSYYVCLQNNNLNYVQLIENSETKVTNLNHLIESSSGYLKLSVYQDDAASVLITTSPVSSRIIYFKEGKDWLHSTIVMPNAIGTTDDDKTLALHLEGTTNPSHILIKSTNLQNGDELGKEFVYPQGLGKPDIIRAHCIHEVCNLLLSTSDDALLLVHFPEGKILWHREEALSKIVATEILELPVSELDASIENEFTDNNLIGMFLHRISTQAQQLSNFIFGSQLLSKSGLIRDDFGLHKIIVVATKSGKLFGIDTLTGSLAWTYRLPNVKPFKVLGADKMLMYVQRSARYAPAVCILLAEDAATGYGVMLQFDPITGFSENAVVKLNYRIRQAILLPVEDENHIKPLVVVSEDNEVFVYPESSKNLIADKVTNTYLYTVDSVQNELKGFNIYRSGANLKSTHSWTINLGPSEIVALSSKPSNERVHSQGRVLPDRSVYYKYVNPNLIALATLTDDPVHKHVLSIYLVDGVTGFIVYSTSHKKAKGPIHLVHSENWLVYSYFSERFRRTEVVAVELYEGSTQSNSTVFSSLAISQIPQVETQSYILPSFPLTMAVTLTERGITNKFLLFALNNGVVEIPWLLLQPRFADIPCGPEESCIPYMPEIPLPYEAYINYNQTLGRINGIAVAPAKLESTSHILVYGLDLFYTRVAPSKTFDLLKEDFDHVLIVLVLFGLVALSIGTNYFASMKALRQAWK